MDSKSPKTATPVSNLTEMPRKPTSARLYALSSPSADASVRCSNSVSSLHSSCRIQLGPESSRSLAEALVNDKVYSNSHSITTPPPAHLRSPRLVIRRTPPLERPLLLEGIARATLPLASVIQVQNSGGIPGGQYGFIPNLSQPGRSSLDSLRSLQSQDRSIKDLYINANSAPSSPSPSQHALGLDYFSPTSWWSNNKTEVDHLLHSDDQAPTAEEEESKIRKRYHAPKNPVVFCHGLLGFDSISLGPAIAPLQISHWKGIKEVMQANGVEVLITRVPATSSPEERAKVLADTIAVAYKGRSVHLIGHSMGGLDCRYVASHLQSPERFTVLSVTTIATPHRGSTFADYFMETIGERLPTMLSFLDMLPNGGGDGKAFESLKSSNMEGFNSQTPDSPNVRYFSWGAQYEPGLLDPFKLPHSIVLQKEGPNDGLVSVESSKWGTYLGTLDGVSHLDLVGWINTARYRWAEWTGKGIKFKPATFYLELVDYLAMSVEGKGEHKLPRDSNTSPIEAEDGGVD